MDKEYYQAGKLVGAIKRHNEYSCYFYIYDCDHPYALLEKMIFEASGIGYQYGFLESGLDAALYEAFHFTKLKDYYRCILSC